MWDPELLWVRFFDSGEEANGDRVDEIVVDSEGGIRVTGAFARSPSRLFIAELDSSGGSVQTYELEAASLTNARGLAQVEGGFLVGGHGNSVAGGTDRLLVEFDDALGEFAEPFDFGPPQEGLDIVEAVVTGEDLRFVAGVTQVGGEQQAWLERLPTIGPSWSVEMGTHSGGNRAVDLYRLGPPDNFDLLVAGALADMDGNDTAWVARYSISGAQQWSESYPDSLGYPNVARGITEGQSGNLFVVGTVLVPGQGLNAWVQRLTPNGNTSWQDSFDGVGADDVAAAVSVADDGDVLVCGSQSTDSSGADLWVARLSPDGERRGSFVHDLGDNDDDTIAACAVQGDNLIIAGRGHTPNGVRRDGFVAALPLDF